MNTAYDKYKNVNPFSPTSNGTNAEAILLSVCIPRDTDRDDYITTFYNTGTLCAISADGEFYNRVAVSSHLMSDIVFPEDNRSRGSRLITVVTKKSKGNPIAVGILKFIDEYDGDVLENSFKLSRNFIDNIVSIRGNAEDATLVLTVKGQLENQGLIDINVTNPELNAMMKVFVAGSLRLGATSSLLLSSNKTFAINIIENKEGGKSAIFSYVLERGFLLNDEFGNKVETTEQGISTTFENTSFIIQKDKMQSKVGNNEVNISPETIELGGVGKAVSSAVKGQDLVSILQELISAIELLTVNTAGVPSTPPINIAQFTAVKAKLSQFLSTKIKIE